MASANHEISAEGLTHIGKVRAKNEDAYFSDASRGLFIVSDGLGGHKGGEIASKFVVEHLPDVVAREMAGKEELACEDLKQILYDAVTELSGSLLARSVSDDALHGMGATVVALQITRQWANIVHVGDSRAYMHSQKALVRLTEDHSVASLLSRQSPLLFELAAQHPLAHLITRYVGMAHVPLPEVRTVRLHVGDRLLLCTDGLTRMLPEPRIGELLAASADSETACHQLVDAALAAGGNDNVTTVVVEWK